MDGTRMASFLFEVDSGSPPRSPKTPYSAIAPPRIACFARRRACVTLDPISEEDGFDQFDIPNLDPTRSSMLEPFSSSPSSSSSSSHGNKKGWSGYN